jgi:hypothetical protein
MELSRKRDGFWRSVTGVTGVMLLACTACCLPLVAPLLAWLGVAGLSLLGPYGMLAAALGAVAIVSVMLMRWRRRRHTQCHSAESVGKSSCQMAGCTPPRTAASEAIVAPNMPAPIACTLSTSDFKERASWLKELKARALLSHRYEGLSMHFSYRLEAADDVEKMVRQEQECCSFLQFDLRRTGTTMELTITAPAEAAADAQVLFAHLVQD